VPLAVAVPVDHPATKILQPDTEILSIIDIVDHHRSCLAWLDADRVAAPHWINAIFSSQKNVQVAAIFGGYVQLLGNVQRDRVIFLGADTPGADHGPENRQSLNCNEEKGLSH
jgi:hypothetical protein